MLYFLQTRIPKNAHLEKGLNCIYGIGLSSSKLSLKIYGLCEDAKGKDLRRIHKLQLKSNFENFPRPLAADLKHIHKSNCQRLIDIRSYKGRRHIYGFPVRGQRTHTNAKNQKRLHKRWILNTIASPKVIFSKKKSKKTQKPNQKPKNQLKTKKAKKK
jgi:small subunit ribosomal protein S13